MIILSTSVKDGVFPSVNRHTIANCAGHRIGNKGAVLCVMDGKTVLDFNNKNTLCVEDWKLPVD